MPTFIRAINTDGAIVFLNTNEIAVAQIKYSHVDELPIRVDLYVWRGYEWASLNKTGEDPSPYPWQIYWAKMTEHVIKSLRLDQSDKIREVEIIKSTAGVVA